MFGFAWSVLVGVMLGFGFGVGCALAVMYGIYMGGYRAALRDLAMDDEPERLTRAREKIAKTVDSTGIRR